MIEQEKFRLSLSPLAMPLRMRDAIVFFGRS